MGIEELLKSKRDEILRIAARHGAYNVRVFGSVARSDMRPDSDIDFLVDLEPGRSLFDLGGTIADLQDLLGREINIMTEAGLKERVRDHVLKEAVPL
ncbi:MAG: nucleotidyltransferase family protein [Acidobacteria bacterium]|nr:nucleotidyltransferase family protein [Acidobacteriota bacterium]